MTTISILSSHAALEMLSELAPRFERTAGRRLSFSYDPASVIRRRINSGISFDVAIVNQPVIELLCTEGKIASESRIDFGRCGLGVAVRKGAPKPDISTVEGFKQALLSAKSVVRSAEGRSGLYFDSLLHSLGIFRDMHSKIRLGPSGRVAELVARGEAELAVQQIPELLPVLGTEFVGPFPPELQLYTVFSVGISTASANWKAASTFIDALATLAVSGMTRAKGFEPIVGQ